MRVVRNGSGVVVLANGRWIWRSVGMVLVLGSSIAGGVLPVAQQTHCSDQGDQRVCAIETRSFFASLVKVELRNPRVEDRRDPNDGSHCVYLVQGGRAEQVGRCSLVEDQSVSRLVSELNAGATLHARGTAPYTHRVSDHALVGFGLGWAPLLGFVLLVFVPFDRLTLDLRNKRLQVVRWRGFRLERQAIAIEEVQEIIVETTDIEEDGPRRRLVARMRSGEKRPLSAPSSTSHEEALRASNALLARRARDYR